MKDGGADMIKVDAAADFPDAVRALVTRRHSGVRAVRPDAADRGEARHSLQRAEFAGRAGHRRGRGEARRRGEDAGRRRRLRARLHQLRAGGRRRGGEGGEDPGDRRLRRRAVARRPGAARPHRDRLRRQVARLQDRHLRQHREGRARRLHRADRRRARRTSRSRADGMADSYENKYEPLYDYLHQGEAGRFRPDLSRRSRRFSASTCRAAPSAPNGGTTTRPSIRANSGPGHPPGRIRFAADAGRQARCASGRPRVFGY